MTPARRRTPARCRDGRCATVEGHYNVFCGRSESSAMAAIVRASSLRSLRTCRTTSSGRKSFLRSAAPRRRRGCGCARGLLRRARRRGAVRQPRQDRPQFRLAFRQPRHQLLSGAHLIAQLAQLLGQRQQVRVGGDPPLFAARQGPLQRLQTFRCLLEQRLDINRDRLLALSSICA